MYEYGDVNLDNEINVLDVIGLVNIIMGIDDYFYFSDLNEDGEISILDAILLVNIILEV